MPIATATIAPLDRAPLVRLCSEGEWIYYSWEDYRSLWGAAVDFKIDDVLWAAERIADRKANKSAKVRPGDVLASLKFDKRTGYTVLHFAARYYEKNMEGVNPIFGKPNPIYLAVFSR